MTIEELVRYYPRIYHMAESGTWDSIRKNGLLSTSALLDFFEVNGEERKSIEERHRPESVVIAHPKHGRAVIRDQKPMRESALRKCLDNALTPADWYRTLNRRVFFWVREERLNGLLNARAYREKSHCVLTVDTAELLRRHTGSVRLSRINSGSTIYTPQPRGLSTFMSIADYPFASLKKRAGRNAVVELVVDYSIPDIFDFVVRVEQRKGNKATGLIFSKA